MSTDYKALQMLQSENYTRTEELNKCNRKIMDRVFRYLSSFPVDEYDVLVIQRDLISMAAEAEERGETLENAIDEDIKKFCDRLVFAVTGIEVPRGRNYLRIAGAYYKFAGAIFLLSSIIGICGSVLLLLISPEQVLTEIGVTETTMHTVIMLVLSALSGMIYWNAGKTARANAANALYGRKCMVWGGMIAGMEFLAIGVNVVYSAITGSGAAFTSDLSETALLMADLLSGFLTYGFLALYLVGAWLNMKEAGKVEKRR